jgi:hypothetical protein
LRLNNWLVANSSSTANGSGIMDETEARSATSQQKVPEALSLKWLRSLHTRRLADWALVDFSRSYIHTKLMQSSYKACTKLIQSLYIVYTRRVQS